MTQYTVQRVQTGVRLERSLLKVLKALAEYTDLSLGDLMEGIVLHAFEGRCAFSPETQAVIIQLKEIYGMAYGAERSHLMVEADDASASGGSP